MPWDASTKRAVDFARGRVPESWTLDEANETLATCSLLFWASAAPLHALVPRKSWVTPDCREAVRYHVVVSRSLLSWESQWQTLVVAFVASRGGLEMEENASCSERQGRFDDSCTCLFCPKRCNSPDACWAERAENERHLHGSKTVRMLSSR